MTDVTTSAGQRHLLAELDRRNLRLTRDNGGNYQLETKRLRSTSRDLSTPLPQWTRIATFPNLAAIAAALDEIGEVTS